ncbi:beta-1,3-glucosyltransferase [Calliphora vicina]|uniref:beta-1,3-glucosyltransferase n=1 Tax=Calliphora vicina TaxID=7373 RepID=UPI00325ABC4D
MSDLEKGADKIQHDLEINVYNIEAPAIEVVFIIQSQGTKYHSELSRNLKENIIKQSVELQPKYRIQVHVLHEILNYPGGWTIHNLIPQLMLLQSKSHVNTMEKNTNEQKYMEVINDNTRWIVFCEERTRVKVKLLMDKLKHENHTQHLYLGKPLYDREPTIIHHFAFFENPKWFPYPMLSAGVVFSMRLFKSIADIYANHNNKKSTILHRSEFSIDAAHELARFIYDNVQLPTVTKTTIFLKNNKNTNIKNTKTFVGHQEKTATTNKPTHTTTPTHGDTSNAEVTTTNVSDLSHSDFSSTTRSNINSKKQKVMLKKASYICPTATWESQGMNNIKSDYIRTSNNNNEDDACAMYADQTANAASSMTCAPVNREEIYFAVKTCSKYHHERLPIIQNTWASYAKHVKYFSDFQDDTIPTINTGVPNVEMGHCAKTLQILKLALRDIENYNTRQQSVHHFNPKKHENHQIQWLFLSDDDTLLSVSGVCQVLGCYNSMDDIYLGERYGYRLHAQDGFNYITGGGGIAFSLPVVRLILQQCSCPSPSAPDDMILGSCLHSIQLQAIHSSRFHQARPNDYPFELWKQEPPVSFHKFWQLDPVDVYNQLFAAQDRQLVAEENLVLENLIDLDFSSKTRKLLANTESLNLNEIPVSLVASLHHSKERHVDL